MKLNLKASRWIVLVTLVVVFAVAWALLGAESEWDMAILAAAVIVLSVAARVLHLAPVINASVRTYSGTLGALCIVGTLGLVAWFSDDPFTLLLLCTVLLYAIAGMGLNLQFGLVGIVNFAGAAFFGVGAYTAAVLLKTGTPQLLVVVLGGVMAAILSCLLILPVLRTRGHYAALVTIAFAVLFRNFLEVNDTLGGSQGMKLPSLNLFGWDLGSPIEIGDYEVSFYANYAVLALVLCVLAYVLVRRVERSWLGVSMDVVRTDEVAASVFGVSIARSKVIAFMLGNFLVGIAGAVYATMTGYIAPNNFSFSDSLILVSILLLGGIGNPWGLFPAAALILILPQKLQFIQEYRFLLYGVLIIFVLLFRSQGLLPRSIRTYFPLGGRS